MPPAPDWFWIVSPLILIAGWFVVNSITSKRELNNWRRTTLTNAVSSMIEASNKRRSLVMKIEDARERPRDLIEEQEHLMLTARLQINICMAESLSRHLRTIENLHRTSSIAIEVLETSWGVGPFGELPLLSDEEINDHLQNVRMKTPKLEWSHRRLIRELQIELKLRKFEFYPDDALVLNRRPKKRFRLPARLQKWIWIKKREASHKRATKKLSNVEP